MGIYNTKDALDLVSILELGQGKFLSIVVGEPSFLAKVRALAGHLEEQPLVFCEFLGNGRVVKLSVLIVSLDKILEDSARL